MKRWGATAIVWLTAPAVGLMLFLAVSTLTSGQPYSLEDFGGILFAVLWVGAAAWARGRHAGAGKVIHVLGCIALLPAWILLVLLSFL